ncbi:L,D-transpeptidase [Parvicella tangerina]|nr:L,D-transpeptidase [Parvicella tangerina]
MIEPQHQAASELICDYLEMQYPDVQVDRFLYVGVERQEMYYVVDRKVERVYDVSTSKHGAGLLSGSNCTPVGMHCVNGKYGADVPWGGILVGRKFTGKVAEVETEPVSTGRDEITSRVITIKGLEDGVNKGGKFDSYQRRIYIHGTAEEGLIGKPASHGCIRMRNDDVIELFALVDEGLPIIILDN